MILLDVFIKAFDSIFSGQLWWCGGMRNPWTEFISAAGEYEY